jgi:hypothetical protein
MTEIDIVKGLIEKYRGVNLNEAETRFKIIDETLEKVLKWPKSESSVELFIEGN